MAGDPSMVYTLDAKELDRIALGIQTPIRPRGASAEYGGSGREF